MSIQAIASSHVLLEHKLSPATILYSTISGKIIHIFHGEVLSSLSDKRLQAYAVTSVNDVSPNAILPGLVDTHVHLNDPGRTHWEGFESGTKSAISGGVTTVVDMPLNSTPPTSTVKNLNLKIDASKGNIWCDVALWGALVPENTDDLIPLVNAGVRGFKGFLCHSGIEEYRRIDRDYIINAMDILKGSNVKMLFHAELTEEDNQAVEDNTQDPTKYATFLNSRPDELETNGIAMVIDCLRGVKDSNPSFGAHIVHLASAMPLDLIRSAKRDNLPLTVETCFHYLTLDSEQIPDSAPQYKCCPPIRSKTNRLKLWDALRDNIITSVVSDHSPCVPELKHIDTGDYMKAWGGISSVGLNLPLMWTTGSNLEKPITIPELVTWCCENTAKQVGLNHIKGYIAVGYDADFVIFDPELPYTYKDVNAYFKNKLTPYNESVFDGMVRSTILRGKVVYTAEDGTSQMSSGSLLLNV
mgnify:CR=1 FL=1